jgi:hypothetical protein
MEVATTSPDSPAPTTSTSTEEDIACSNLGGPEAEQVLCLI